jgi:SPP1 family predicted phage head-tail adaptor
MDVGELKHRISVEAVTMEQDAVGQLVETWTEQTKVWAKREDGGGTEGEKSDIVTTTQRTNFIIRFRTIDAVTNRIQFQSKIYDIEAVDEIEFKKFLRLRCKQRSSM